MKACKKKQLQKTAKFIFKNDYLKPIFCYKLDKKI